jgi:hypothetical protein
MNGFKRLSTLGGVKHPVALRGCLTVSAFVTPVPYTGSIGPLLCLTITVDEIRRDEPGTRSRSGNRNETWRHDTGAAQEVRELERNLQKGMWVVRGTGEEINLEETPQILEDSWVFIRELCERYGT